MGGTSDLWGCASNNTPIGESIEVRGSNSSTTNNGVGVKGIYAVSGTEVFDTSIGTDVYGISSGNAIGGYGLSGQVSRVGVHGLAYARTVLVSGANPQ